LERTNMVSRRKFLGALVGSGAVCGSVLAGSRLPLVTGSEPARINRLKLVRRHNPHLSAIDPLAPLTVGNGEFAFTADVTGLQTLASEYDGKMPLCTMAQWGWHTIPPAGGTDQSKLRLVQFDTHGRQVEYHTSSEGQSELFNWLRQNPHRLHLAQIGLRHLPADRPEINPAEIAATDQQLDLWTGILTSRFKLQGLPVLVRTAVHPESDLLAVEIESELIRRRALGVSISFPYGSPEMNAADWNQPERHETRLTPRSLRTAELYRRLDKDEYYATVSWTGVGKLTNDGPHRFVLAAETGAAPDSRLAFVVAFSPQAQRAPLPSTATTFAASARHWPEFWNQGAAVELADSRDPRAHELERRVVLSQYLTAVQCSGSLPPQETGLTVNSWYGKFHLEMHWWHAAHFALWGRLPMLEKSLSWYRAILPQAGELARLQGYRGARWPKMTSTEGRDSPSPIGPLLIWQQPHPISYAELCYAARPNRATLERYRDVVFASAEFMASYAYFDPAKGRYVLGPPVIPAQENHPPRETWNPTFELSYWAHGLRIAQRWRERSGMPRVAQWDQIIAQLAPLPVRDGVYLAHENCPQTYTERNRDHPSMLGSLGVLPGDGVDRETMRRTLHKVMREWNWDETWGWDYPMTAMTAARLGETKIAVDALLMQTPKNRYLPNGHNWQRDNLPCYLPGNGGLLYAIAMMAGGWRGAPKGSAPGFPADGSWVVRHEGLDQRVLVNI
jgi:hypothetical protein